MGKSIFTLQSKEITGIKRGVFILFANFHWGDSKNSLRKKIG
jgi:hypothetical protein